MNEHIKTVHKKEKNNFCEICDLSFTQSSHLYVHISKVHNEQSYRCDDCDKHFDNSTNLHKHIVEYHGKTINKENFNCEICGKTLISKAKLSIFLGSYILRCVLCSVVHTSFYIYSMI